MLKASQPTASSGNLTAQWFTQNLSSPRQTASPLYTQMTQAVASRLPAAVRADFVQDCVQNFLAQAIHRDAFANMVKAGVPIPDSKVVSYCVNSARTSLRKGGCNPVLRRYSFRTESDRIKPDVEPTAKPYASPHVRDVDGEWLDDPDTGFDADDAVDFQRLWDRLEAAVQSRHPKVAERYMRILQMRAMGMTVPEISQKEGVSRHRAASLLANARKSARDGFKHEMKDLADELDI